MRKTIGYILLVLSFVSWAVIALLPILDLSIGQIASATTILIFAGEMALLASIAFIFSQASLPNKAMDARNARRCQPA